MKQEAIQQGSDKPGQALIRSDPGRRDPVQPEGLEPVIQVYRNVNSDRSNPNYFIDTDIKDQKG